MSYTLDATHAPVPFSIKLGSITDVEGNPVAASEVKTNVSVSNPEGAEVLSFTFDEASLAGELSFGVVGSGSFNVQVVDKDDPSEVLASSSDAFTLVAGDPSAISSIGVEFEGLTPDAPVEPLPVEPQVPENPDEPVIVP